MYNNCNIPLEPERGAEGHEVRWSAESFKKTRRDWGNRQFLAPNICH